MSLVRLESKKPEKKSGLSVKIGERQQVVPDGEYKVRVEKIEKGQFMAKRPILIFYFEIAEGSYRGHVVRGFVNANYESYSAYTKLYLWYKAVTGDEPEPGTNIELDDFFEKIILVTVAAQSSRKTKNQFSNVKEITRTVLEL